MTTLSVTGTPSIGHTFVAKTAANPVVNRFTQLGSVATPSKIVTFLAKTPAVTTPKSNITKLGVMATPSLLQAFGGKTPSGVDLTPYIRQSTRDVQYEALKVVTTPSDTRTMEREWWKSLFGGNGSTLDIMHEGIIKGLGNSTLKDYYDTITGTVWPDHNTSEKAYWLKVLQDNL